jgi:archaellum component FlaC
MQENLLPILFGVFSSINALYAFINIENAIRIIREWNPRIIHLNESVDGVDELDIDEFEKESETTPLISNTIRKIKYITRKSSDLSVNEIHEVIDDDIMKWENRLNFASNNFIMLGVFFTVLSLFSAIPDEPTTDKIADFLASFKFAFQTTIIGLVLASFTKFLENYIGGKREDFRYNLVLLVKTILVPKYSIPEVDEKNLGELVLSISSSSNALKKAATSIEGLASKTQVGTENIEKAVSGFTVITEKMIKREDSLNRSLGNLSNYLIEIQKNLDKTITPLSNSILEELSQNAVRNEVNLNQIAEFRDSQMAINDNINSSLSMISDSNEQLGKFFGKEFKNIFKKSLEELNIDYMLKLDEISNYITDLTTKLVEKIKDDSNDESISDLKTILVEKIKDDLNDESISDLTNLMQDKFSNIENEISNIHSPINNLKKDLGKFDSAFEAHQDSITSIEESINKLNETLKIIHDSVYKIQDITDQTDFIKMNENTNQVLDGIKSVYQSVETVKSELNNILDKINELPEGKSVGIVSGFRKVFGGGNFKK